MSDDLIDEPAGDTVEDDLFRADLAEARELALTDARFEPLVKGLETSSLEQRMRAVDSLFAEFDRDELARIELPPCLGQLRMVFLRSQ